jgi:AraC-like DNA-binding protein
MDRHDVSEEVTAENVAQLHQEDLKVQDKFNCRGLTYWFDEQRKIAFCLVEAPNEESVHRMHDHAHGVVPHHIIEVDPNLVESFLGRIEDPKSMVDSKPSIINEPGFRTLFAAKIVFGKLNQKQASQLSQATQDYKRKICSLVEACKGTIVQMVSYEILASFVNVNDAINCANTIVQDMDNKSSYLECSIGLDAGNPVSSSKSIFEETIRASKRLSSLKPKVSISSSVYQMYNDKSAELSFEMNQYNLISPSEMVFLNRLSDYLDVHFGQSELSIEDIACQMGYSKSQFYRNMVSLSGVSPNPYLIQFRLSRSLEFLKDGLHSVSEIAFLCGFSSPSYFSRSFTRRYGIPPAAYMRATVE